MKKSLIILIAAALCLALSFTVVAFAVDDSQILVAKDYFDQVVATLATKTYVDNKVSTTGAGEYIVLQLDKGDIISGGASCEMILRAGEANAVIPETASGGICDMTGGADIGNGKAVKTNHHLIFPANDGRAIYVTSDVAYFMVKGSYTVTEYNAE